MTSAELDNLVRVGTLKREPERLVTHLIEAAKQVHAALRATR